jgi:hypothetical protein
MPRYRLVFPPAHDAVYSTSHTAEIDSGDVVYQVGDTISHDGKLWQVSQAPLDVPDLGEAVDLMVWPAAS